MLNEKELHAVTFCLSHHICISTNKLNTKINSILIYAFYDWHIMQFLDKSKWGKASHIIYTHKKWHDRGTDLTVANSC